MKSAKCLAVVLVALVGLALVPSGCAGAQQASYPTKPIDMVVHTDPGGGSDVFVRMVVDMIAKQKLVPQPFNVLNKGGGSGAVAVQYVMEKKADPYTTFAFSNAVGVTMLRGQVTASVTDFVPIANLEIDPNVIQVRADSPYKNLKDLIADAKAKPKQISVGFGSIGSTDQLLAFKLAKMAGVEFNYLSFASGGEAATQMLGGHVDFSMGQPSEAKGQIDAGKVKAIATFTDQRLTTLKDVPTAKEQGYDLTQKLFRGVIGPPNFPKESATYLEGVFKKLTDSQEWKDYCIKNDVQSAFMGSDEYGKLMVDFSKETEPLITEMGLKQKK